MTDLRKAAEMALTKLDHLWEIGIDAEYKVELLPEIHALRQALAQPEWVGLTDEEKEKYVVAYFVDKYDRETAVTLMNDYEAVLKEKNSGQVQNT